ncbi:type I restriction enzyme S subunit [Breoghania corrubedonensis]|uniref:Type I restriction enzyme S subunit n=1 Tax=Breoghania corrubedonensis TaxID=665038 RepID=A0A2T5VCA6_9HYPH|nr:restriction endonuclease subunit S [Breoghania corrubedonensis]PTW61378.1 type I restriction enzyme S subunit [Breoghania corrubedonensis]
MSGLPRGWATAEIRDLCNLVNGKAFKPSDWSDSGLPIVRIQNLNNPDAAFNYFSGEVDPRFLIDEDQLLFAWSGTPGTSFGAHVWHGGKAVLNQHIFKVEFREQDINRKFFRLGINHKLDELIGKAHGGVGLRHVTKGKFEQTTIPLPPLAEQKRIVAKLESLSAKSARARTDLARIDTLVTRYKQAVLTKAFNGELTREWRGQNRGSSKWKSRAIGTLVREGPSNGWSPKTSTDPVGTKTLKLSATTSGKMILNEYTIKYIGNDVDISSRFWLRPGDILIQRANSLEHLGASAIFEGPELEYIYPDLMMRVRVSNEILTRYLWRFLNTEQVRRYFQSRATGTAGNMPKINGKTVRELEIPLPPLPEQKEIVRRIEAAFGKIDRLAAEAKRALALLGKLDEALLAKAFRGELVPQDPADEPASVLLERIKAERAAQPKAGRGRKKVG